MNRRGFFSLLGGAAVAAVIPSVVTEELWTPSRTIFLPPTGGWVRGNVLLTPELITREAWRILSKSMQFNLPDVRQYDASISRANSALKIGDTLRIRMPARLSAAA